MECGEVKQWLTLSRSFAGSKKAAPPVEAMKHLAECSECTMRWQQEQSFDEQVHRSIHKVDTPSHLEQTIQWRLRQGRRQRQRARVFYGSIAAAAALMLAVCLTWYLQRPYDLAYLSEAIEGIEARRNVVRYDVAPGKPATDLQQWLKRQGIATNIPSRLKLQCVTSAYIVETSGRKIAVLELHSGSSTGKVCLLERRFFNEQLQRQWRDQAILSSMVIADDDHSASLGWMIVDQGSAHLFVDGMPSNNGA